MKITKAELKKAIKHMILEWGNPAPSKPSPGREPGIAEPDTKPAPKRRTLTPPKEAPKTKPKASGKLSENEKSMVGKILSRYKKMK